MTFEQYLAGGRKAADRDLISVEKELQAMYIDAYKQASSDLEKFLAKGFSPEEVRKYGRLTQLIEGIKKEYKKLSGKALDTTLTAGADTFIESFKYLEFALDATEGVAVGFGMPPVDVVRLSVNSDHAGLSVEEIYGKNVISEFSKIQGTITRGIIQGQGYKKMAGLLKDDFAGGYKNALRVIRTENTRLWTEGQLESIAYGEDLGIKFRTRWIASLDQRTRESHAMLDGEYADENGLFWIGSDSAKGPGLFGIASEDINCFPGHMIPVAVDIEKLYKREYSGNLIGIKTSFGSYFEVTVNHPILTDKGWVPSGILNKGSNIISMSLGKKPGIGCKIKNGPSTFAEVYNLSSIKSSIHNVHGTVIQFHGDGSNGEVEIKTVDRCLPVKNNSSILHKLKQFIFTAPNILHSFFSSNSPSNKFILFSGHPSNSIMRSLRKSLSFLGSRFGHPSEHPLASIPLSNSIISQDSNNNRSTDIKSGSNRLNGLPIGVFFDEVVDIQIKPYSGHVYNLQTSSGMYGLYNNNGIVSITHNCRCAITQEVEGFPAEERRIKGEGVVKYTNFTDWAESKGWTPEKGWPKVEKV